MLSEDKYFKTLNKEQLWQRYCGFLDLSADEFVEQQKSLLMDEIDRVAASVLGKKIMGDRKPATVEEFRQAVPFTTYEDYEPYLSEKREDALAEKPGVWCHSAGRSGDFKWVPHCAEFPDKITKACICLFALAQAERRGDFKVRPGVRFLFVSPPGDYATSHIIPGMNKCFSFKPIPPPETADRLGFPERVKLGYQIALRTGVDSMFALTSVMVKMGESMSEHAQRPGISPAMLHPGALSRMMRAMVRSKLERRKILPKDLWPVKAIITSGIDAGMYKEGVRKYWGKEPFEFYGGTEFYLLAVQDWRRNGMVFYPEFVFIEFLPYDEKNKNYDASRNSVLLNQVEAGKMYEVVITQFYGMPLLRYRLKDVIKIISLNDDEAGVNLPHFVFQRRIGETINLAALAHLDEKTIWQALANTKVKVNEWTACKEYDGDQSFLRLYLELNENRQPSELETLIDEQLKNIDIDYRDIGEQLRLQPVRVTCIPTGTFHRYMEAKQKAGADMAHLKLNHVNPSPESVRELLRLAGNQ